VVIKTLFYHRGKFSTHLWQDGSISSSFTVENTGIYWVKVNGENACSGSDTISITLYNPPNINIGKDTSICPGEIINLDPGGGYVSYLWQDSSTFQTYQANKAGTYWVEVFNDNCTSSDLIIIFDCPLPFII
jgi:hypothetical protein